MVAFLASPLFLFFFFVKKTCDFPVCPFRPTAHIFPACRAKLQCCTRPTLSTISSTTGPQTRTLMSCFSVFTAKCKPILGKLNCTVRRADKAKQRSSEGGHGGHGVGCIGARGRGGDAAAAEPAGIIYGAIAWHVCGVGGHQFRLDPGARLVLREPRGGCWRLTIARAF